MIRLSISIQRGRRGATLTEVLLAILILSIGVSSVIALFPISILNSVKATQLTNARLLKEDVEQIIRVNPQYLTATTNGNVPVLQFGWSANKSYGNLWTSNTVYSTGDIVTPSPSSGSFRSEPFRMFRAIVVDGSGVYVGGSARSGMTEPKWGLNTVLVSIAGVPKQAFAAVDSLDSGSGNRIVWEPVDTGTLAGTIDTNLKVTNSWVLDSLGSATFGSDTTAPLAEFGCVSSDGSGNRSKDGIFGESVTQFGWASGLPRTNIGLTSVNTARFLSTHPDAWSEVARVTPLAISVGATSTTLTLPPNTPVTSNSNMRLVIRNQDGTRSVTRTFTYNAGPPPQLSFSPNLPAGFATLGTVSIEFFDSRYTWFATINNSSAGNPAIKVAVLFKRKFLPGEEHIYRAVYGNDGDDDNDMTVFSNPDPAVNASWPGGISTDQVFVVWDSLNEPRPLIQEGKYVFEPNPSGAGVQWYKIVNVQITEPTLLNQHGSAIITFDRPVSSRTPDSGALGRAMLLRGIVEVFDL